MFMKARRLMEKTNKTEFIPVRVEPELKARLAAAADFECVSMSEIVRRLIKSIPVIGVIRDGKVELKEE